jgi:hypothetical protein
MPRWTFRHLLSERAWREPIADPPARLLFLALTTIALPTEPNPEKPAHLGAEARCSSPGLVRMTGLSRRTVVLYLHRLEDQGLIAMRRPPRPRPGDMVVTLWPEQPTPGPHDLRRA